MRVFLFIGFGILFVYAGVLGNALFHLGDGQRGLAAVFTNDSNIVDLGTVPGTTEAVVGTVNDPNEPPIDLTSPLPSTPSATQNTTEAVLLFSDETPPPSSPASSGTPSAISTVITTVPPPPFVSAEETTSAGGGEGGSTPTGSIDSEALIDTLIQNQALTISTSGGGGGGVSVRIRADRLRAAFAAEGISALAVPNRSELLGRGAGRAALSRNDFTIFVAETILRDSYIDSVVFANGTLTTTYRARGRLLGFLPTRYRLGVSASFTEGQLRQVSLRFPWYSFFLAKGASAAVLEQKITALIQENIAGVEGEYDVATRAFLGMSDVLNQLFGDI